MEKNFLRQKQQSDMIDLLIMMAAISAGMLCFFYLISKLN